MNTISFIKKSIQEESTLTSIEGWIFTNFHHRDHITDQLLELSPDSVSTRRWVYFLPTQGTPQKIVHRIEANILDSLPGDTLSFSSLEELENILQNYKDQKWAILSDKHLSVISQVDGGFIELLTDCGIKITSAATLVQRCKGLLSPAGIKSHERAASLLYKIVEEAWELVCFKYNTEQPLSEREIDQFILKRFSDYSLTTDHPPIIAFGKNAGNPHYEVPENNSAIAQKGDIIQFDLWAKEQFARDEQGKITSEAGIYADISWVGVYDKDISPEIEKYFSQLCKARDVVFQTIENSPSPYDITGASLDKAVREALISFGYKDFIKHRTGHGIDTECHGSGVNLDSIEFPDNRKLLEGSCFSVEPGIYLPSFGMRTEIDIYISHGKPQISGSLFLKSKDIEIPQQHLLRIH